MNLFIEMHELKVGTEERRFGTGWENLFTKQFAFFLEADVLAATAVARLLLNDEITGTYLDGNQSLSTIISNSAVEAVDRILEAIESCTGANES